MPSACAQRGRPSEALGRTVSQSAGSEAYVANSSITPSSSTSVIFADCRESYVAYYHQDRTHYALENETPAVVFPLPRREPALLSWLAGGWAVRIHWDHWAASKNGRIDFGELHRPRIDETTDEPRRRGGLTRMRLRVTHFMRVSVLRVPCHCAPPWMPSRRCKMSPATPAAVIRMGSGIFFALTKSASVMAPIAAVGCR